MPASAETTQVLLDLSRGESSAARRLMPLIYDELRALAQAFLAQERSDHTLQATALVHEAYLRLIDQTRVDWQGRAHFFAVASQMIRRVLVDHARQRHAAKRGGSASRVLLTDAVESHGSAAEIDVLALDEALEELGKLNERHRRVVELRYFGGLSDADAAHVLGVSPQTIRLDWRMARAWLRQRLEG